MNNLSVEGRTVVVTGATSGLGLAAARELAALAGWTVVVAARDPQRGAQTARELGGGAVSLQLDLADLASVRAFADLLSTAALPPLAAVVANAGIQYRDRLHTTAEGYEATFGTNHLGHHLLLRLLLPALAQDGRIVIVASGTHEGARLRNLGFPAPRWGDASTLAAPGSGSGQVAYATSKLANVMEMFELRRRLAELRPGTQIAVHGFDPGLMPDTGLSRDYPPLARRVYAVARPVLAWLPGVTTAAASAAQLRRMVTAPEFAAPSGRYIALDQDREPSAEARDPRLARALWEDTERLVAA